MKTSPSVIPYVNELQEARKRTLELVADLNDDQMIGPHLDIVNPLRWEIGHIAWFQEYWVLRHLGQSAPILAEGDALYDSARVDHHTRWDLPLPSKAQTIDYMRRVLDRVLDRCDQQKEGFSKQVDELSKDRAYFLSLVLFHEDMHAEAITYTRQTLGYAPPRLTNTGKITKPKAHLQVASHEKGSEHSVAAEGLGDALIPGGTFLLGSTPDQPFVFDNEMWAHRVEVQPFAIARTAVTNAEYAAFVHDGGYSRRELWSDDGWQWLENIGAKYPPYWQPTGGGEWLRRDFDKMISLEDHLPVLHVNWYEADAYCRWAGRRLPTEAEWEMAACAEPTRDGRGITERKRQFPWGDEPPTPERANLDWHAMGCVEVGALPAGDSAFGCRQMIGNVWEWTASDFAPFPGFVAGPYKEYSAPWFGDHKVLRGGCWTTRSRLIHSTYRNFYKPDRRDVWAGFRTCADYRSG